MKPSREEMIEDLLHLVDDWDIDDLVYWVQDELETKYEKLTDADIEWEYNSAFDIEDEDEIS